MNTQNFPASANVVDLNLAVTEEWHALPLPDGDGVLWAKELAGQLSEGAAAEALALELADVYTRLTELDNRFLSAAVYLPRANFGFLDCLLTYEVVERAGGSTPEAFLREADQQKNVRTVGMLVRDVFTWTDTIGAGELVGSRTINTYRTGDDGWAEERVVIGVFPPGCNQYVVLTFTMYILNAIDDLPAFAQGIVETLELELEPGDAS